MIIKGCSSITQLKKISIFENLKTADLEQLIPHSYVKKYHKDELIMLEKDRLDPQLYALVDGTLQVSKTTTNGKETVVRLIPPGELFAAPALFGNCIAPATVSCQLDSEILTIKREGLLTIISQNPEVSLRILEVFNDRLQQLHNTVHSLISERAIVRLIRLIQYQNERYGNHLVEQGNCLNVKFSYYQIARSIGITYEECVRLFKKLKEVVIYQRGGTIIITDWQKLEAMSFQLSVNSKG